MPQGPISYRGYEIADSNGRGGKAGKGHNKTATIQVREPLRPGEYLLLKQFRYKVDDLDSGFVALMCALNYVNSLTCAFLMHVEKGHGGHISYDDGRSSLCGIEKRQPNVDHECDFHGAQFEIWLKINFDFVCRTCLKKHLKSNSI